MAVRLTIRERDCLIVDDLDMVMLEIAGEADLAIEHVAERLRKRGALVAEDVPLSGDRAAAA